MVAILIALAITGALAGKDKVKAARKKKKAQRAAAEEHEARERRFNSSKAREASEERRKRREEEIEDEDEFLDNAGAGSSSRALADNRGQTQHPDFSTAPPPYVKNAPTYDESFSHARVEPSSSASYEQRGRELSRANGGVQQDGGPQSTRPRSPPRPGETEEQRKKRKRAEFFRSGKYISVLGVGLAR